MEAKVVYFRELGEINTDETLSLSRHWAEDLDIRTILVASSSGDTGVRALSFFQGFNLVVVTHCYGIKEPNQSRFTDENRQILDDHRVRIFQGTPAFGGISQAVAGARHSGPPLAPGESPSQIGNSFGDIIGSTLGFFGRGMKVAAEITLMAADAGLVRTDEDVISIAGTRAGADTAIVIRPSNTHRFYNLRINRVICKPRL